MPIRGARAWIVWFAASLFLVAGCDGRIAEIARPDLARKPPPTSTPATTPAKPPDDPWLPLRADYLHDPDNPALHFLQEPAEALSALPRSTSGNYVDWTAALRSGAIDPRTNIQPETKVNLLDLDILFEETAGQPIVLFPHLQHTEWLDCSNCHDKLFIPKKGANPVNMLAILNGEFCGQCHGAVSFPLTECARCHSVPRKAPSAS
jgi:c(7)-type cytochrome triheme protein